jgi:hypothetical protein
VAVIHRKFEDALGNRWVVHHQPAADLVVIEVERPAAEAWAYTAIPTAGLDVLIEALREVRDAVSLTPSGA